MKYILAIGVAAVGYMAFLAWLRRQPDPKLAAIVPPKVIYKGSDEGLRERTLKRRVTAEGMRRRAALVDSGEPVADILRRPIVKAK